MHVVFICNQLPPAPGGILGSVVACLARGLAARGQQVTVIGLYDRDYSWSYPGVQIVPIFNARRQWYRPLAQDSDVGRERIHRELLSLHTKVGIEVVEWPDDEGLYLRLIPGITDVVRNYGPKGGLQSKSLSQDLSYREKQERQTLRSIPNWIGMTQWFTAEWQRIADVQPIRTTVVYHPVDLDLFRPEFDPQRLDPNLVLFAGSYRPRNGVLTLLRAANQFLRRCPEARLELYGRDRAEARSLEGEIHQELRHRVAFSDLIPQVPLAELLRRAAVFARPSLLDSVGTAWVEAMASGVAVVGSLHACGPEIVPDGVAGLLTDPTDASNVAAAVERLLMEPATRQRMAVAGRALAQQRHSFEACVRQTLDFYQICRASSG